MKSNKTTSKNKAAPAVQKTLLLSKAAAVGELMLSLLLEQINRSIEVIEREKKQRRRLCRYVHFVNQKELENQVSLGLPENTPKMQFICDEQPNTIAIDNLSYACLDKIQQKMTKSLLVHSKSVILKPINQAERRQSPLNRSSSLKLPLETIQQTKIERQLRQQKFNDEAMKQKELEQAEKERVKQEKKKWQSIDGVCFDFNGKLMWQRQFQQDNLIQKVIKDRFKKQKIVKRVSQPLESESVVGTVKKGYQKKNRDNLPVQSQFTEFFDNQSLADSIEITKGIRYSHNALVFEEKKKQLPPIELKNSLGKRRISKRQFDEVRDFVGKKKEESLRKLKTERFQESRHLQKRAYSEANFNQSRLNRREAINVINPELRESMLIKLSEYQPFLVIQRQLPSDDEDERLRLKQGEDQISMSDFSRRDIDSMLGMSQSVIISPKLPALTRRQTPISSNSDELVITKLQRELQNKLRI